MRRIILAFAVAIGLASCADPAPPITQGTVLDKHYDDPDDWITRNCSTVNKQTVCNNVHHHDGPHWTIELTPCRRLIELKDGCRTGWVEVDLTSYNRASIGEYFT